VSADEYRELLRDFRGSGLADAPNEIFRPWAEEFACRVRELQDLGLEDGEDLGGKVMRTLRAMQGERKAGFVFGLSRDHSDDWGIRIARARQERERMTSSQPRTVSTKIQIPAEVRAQVVEGADADDTDDDLDVGAFPLLRDAARSKGMVLVGGVVKRDKLDRIRRNFGEHVEWIATDTGGTTAISSLENRVRARSVGAIVVLNGIIGHRHFEPLVEAARASSVPLAYGWRAGKASLAEAFREIEVAMGRVSSA
jgi:hypothetical protein